MLTHRVCRYPLKTVFRIARGARTHAEVVQVSISRDGVTGHGECMPYARYAESIDSVVAQIDALPDDIDRQSLQSALAAGAARNAVDCALWDLESKTRDLRAWELANIAAPQPTATAYTLSLDTPDAMRAAATAAADRPLLKIKLGGEEDIARLEAVRKGAPNTAIIVDANEGWNAQLYQEIAPYLCQLGVLMVEQPLPAADDAALADIPHPLPICADESCHTRADLPNLVGRYDMINIKLDKTGGLTEALALQSQAEQQGFRSMIGCMVSSSLSMAPATLLSRRAEIVDLDGPLLLAEDYTPQLKYADGCVHPPLAQLWG